MRLAVPGAALACLQFHVGQIEMVCFAEQTSALLKDVAAASHRSRENLLNSFWLEYGWEQRENAGSLCQKFCCGLLHRSTHRSHRRQSAVTCSADPEPP